MEILPSKKDDLNAINAVASRLRHEAMSYESLTDYLATAFSDTDDMMAYTAFCIKLGEMRSALVQLTPDSPRGALKLAMGNIKEVLSADSLRHGYMFGMVTNDELLAENGIVSRMALDRLAPYVDEIFDDILATSESSNDLVWTFRLFGENMYVNTLAHPNDPSYDAINNRPDPIKPLIDDICNELYPTPDDDTDFLSYERRETDTTNFKHGFAIARRACNAYLLSNRLS